MSFEVLSIFACVGGDSVFFETLRKALESTYRKMKLYLFASIEGELEFLIYEF